MKKQIITILLLVGILLSITACSSKNKAENELIVGVCAGPYQDLFKQAIEPELIKKGYSVKYVEFSDYIQPNNALSNKEIDLNVFQHSIYLNNFSKQHNLDLTFLTEIPTASMGVFSTKHNNLDNIPNGATIALPNDETNLSRALRVLEQSKIIELNSDIDKSKATIKDISNNPKNLKFNEVNAEILPTVLDSVDLAVINGNYAIGAGLDLSKAIFNEKLSDGYFNVIAVRSEDQDKEFSKNINEIVHSSFFESVINDPNNQFIAFEKPKDFSK